MTVTHDRLRRGSGQFPYLATFGWAFLAFLVADRGLAVLLWYGTATLVPCRVALRRRGRYDFGLCPQSGLGRRPASRSSSPAPIRSNIGAGLPPGSGRDTRHRSGFIVIIAATDPLYVRKRASDRDDVSAANLHHGDCRRLAALMSLLRRRGAGRRRDHFPRLFVSRLAAVAARRLARYRRYLAVMGADPRAVRLVRDR